LEKCLCREYRSSKRAGDYDDELRKQSNFDNLVEKQFPTELMGKNGTKRVSSQQDEFTEILDKRDERCAEGAKEVDHYGRSNQLQLIGCHSERSEESLINLRPRPRRK
jgi:hypothetical protein